MIVKLFKGPSQFLTIYSHLILFSIRMVISNIFFHKISDFISFTSFWFIHISKVIWPLTMTPSKKGSSSLGHFPGDDQCKKGSIYIDGLYKFRILPDHYWHYALNFPLIAILDCSDGAISRRQLSQNKAQEFKLKSGFATWILLLARWDLRL